MVPQAELWRPLLPQSRTYLGMSTLRDLIFKRPSRQFQYLHVLLDLSSHEKDKVSPAERLTQQPGQAAAGLLPSPGLRQQVLVVLFLILSEASPVSAHPTRRARPTPPVPTVEVSLPYRDLGANHRAGSEDAECGRESPREGLAASGVRRQGRCSRKAS